MSCHMPCIIKTHTTERIVGNIYQPLTRKEIAAEGPDKIILKYTGTAAPFSRRVLMQDSI